MKREKGYQERREDEGGTLGCIRLLEKEGKWKVNVEEVEARLLGKEGKWKVNVEEVEARLLVGGIRCPCCCGSLG